MEIKYRNLRLNEYIEKLKQSDILPQNKKLIIEFDKANEADGLSKIRRLSYISTLSHICSERCIHCGLLRFNSKTTKHGKPAKCKHKFIKPWLSKSFKKATKDDIMAIMRKIEGNGYASWSIQNYKIGIKKFYKWLKPQKNYRDYPEQVSWIKTTMKDKNRKLPSEMLTSDEIKKLVEATDNVRDKALILTLYESGCRVGELLNLRYKNVQFDKYGTILIVDGKRGMRRIRIIVATPHLAAWYNNHPTKAPDDPLWTNRVHKGKGVLCKKCNHKWIAVTKNLRCPECRSFEVKKIKDIGRGAPITYSGLYSLFSRLFKKADINGKKSNPYLFRHSRATELAAVLTESQLKEIFGWTQASSSPAVYVHLSGRDVDNALLKLHGLLEEEETKDGFKGIKCPRCKLVNLPKSSFCSQCGMPLDTKTAIELERRSEEYDDKIKKLFSIWVERNHDEAEKLAKEVKII
jgi:integrase